MATTCPNANGNWHPATARKILSVLVARHLRQQPIAKGDDRRILGVLRAIDEVIAERTIQLRSEGTDQPTFCQIPLDQHGAAEGYAVAGQDHTKGGSRIV